MPTSKRTQKEWQKYAERKLAKVLAAAQSLSGLRKMGPGTKKPWAIDFSMVGTKAMREMNASYRGKDYATDVLSFPSPDVFFQQGHLGELVICLPTLKKQAREVGNTPEKELLVLLVHGVLHLLGMDHEQGGREAARMTRWEQKLLDELGGRQGLIRRAS